jgi:hypothetical protein
VSPGVAVVDHDNNNIPPFLFGDLSGAVLGQGLYDTVKKEEV